MKKFFTGGAVVALTNLFLFSAFADARESSQPQLTVTSQAISIGSVPRGAQRIPVLSLSLKASCAAPITIETVTVERTGLGASDDILSIFAESEGKRIVRGKRFTREGSATFLFRGFVLPACGTTSVDFKINLSPDASVLGEHRFGVASVETAENALVTLLEKDSSLSVMPAGPSEGTINVEFLRLLQNPKYGNNRQLARIKVSAEGSFSQQLHSIVLTNDGSARDGDLQQLFLEDNRGRRVTNLTSALDGEQLSLTFDPPFLLPKNDERILTLRGNVLASRRKTILFQLEEPSDLVSSVSRVRR